MTWNQRGSPYERTSHSGIDEMGNQPVNHDSLSWDMCLSGAKAILLIEIRECK